MFSGRGLVQPMHPELKGKAVLVSGHHGYTEATNNMTRIICDTSGGLPSEEVNLFSPPPPSFFWQSGYSSFCE